MIKLEKKALSLVFEKEGKALSVRRSPNEKLFPNFWSLPSTYVRENETAVQAAKRLAVGKLGLKEISLKNLPMGVSTIDRGDFILSMSDYIVSLYEGEINLNPLDYTEMRWVTAVELKQLLDKEHQGMMGECCRVFLKAKKII